MPRRTRANPSPGGLKSLDLDAPRKIRQPRTCKATATTAAAAAAEEGASNVTEISLYTANDTQLSVPHPAHSPPTTTSRSQSPRAMESGSQSPQATESRSTSPPPVQHYTRFMARSASRSMSPGQSVDASTPAQPKRSSLAPVASTGPRRSPLGVSENKSPLPRTPSGLSGSGKQSPVRRTPSNPPTVGSATRSPSAGEQRSAKRSSTSGPSDLDSRRGIKRTYSHEVFGPDVVSDDGVEQPRSAKRLRTDASPVKRTPKTKTPRRRSRQLFEPSPQGDSAAELRAVASAARRKKLSSEERHRQIDRLLSGAPSQQAPQPDRIPFEAERRLIAEDGLAEDTAAQEDAQPGSRFAESRNGISEETRKQIEKNIELYADPPNEPRAREAYLKQRGIILTPGNTFGRNVGDRDEPGGTPYRRLQQPLEQDEDSGNESEEWREYQPSVVRNRSIRQDLKALQAAINKQKEDAEKYRGNPSMEISTISSELHIPSTSSTAAHILTIRPDLVDALVSFCQYYENNPAAKPPTPKQLGGLLEFHSQTNQARPVLAITGTQSLRHESAPAVEPSTPKHQPRGDGMSGRPASGAKSISNIAHPAIENDDSDRATSMDNTLPSEVQPAKAQPQTPQAAQAAPQAHGSVLWHGLSAVKNLVATPFRFFGSRSTKDTNKADTTNGEPVPVPTNPFTIDLTKSGLAMPPASPLSPSARPAMTQSERRRKVPVKLSRFSQTAKVVRHRPLERKHIPIAARGLVSQERIAEIHAEQDLLAKERCKNRKSGGLTAEEEAEESQDHAAKHAGPAVAGEKRKRHPYGIGRTADGGFCVPDSSDSEDELEPSTHNPTPTPLQTLGASMDSPSPTELRKKRTPRSRLPLGETGALGSPVLDANRPSVSTTSSPVKGSLETPSTAHANSDGSFTQAYEVWNGEKKQLTWHPSHGINAKATLLCGIHVACYNKEGQLLPKSDHIPFSDVISKAPEFKELRALPVDVQDYILDLRGGKDLRFRDSEHALRDKYYDLEKKIYDGKIDMHRDEIYRLLEDANAPRYGATANQAGSGGSKKQGGRKPIKPVVRGRYEVPSDSSSDEEEGEGQQQHEAANSTDAVLQERTWTQTPPPKPRPANAELPKSPSQTPGVPEAARASQVDKYKPKTPSQLRHVTAMSPLQEEAALNGKKSSFRTPGVTRVNKNVHFTPPPGILVSPMVSEVWGTEVPEEFEESVIMNGAWEEVALAMVPGEEGDGEGDGNAVGAWDDMSWEGTGREEVRQT